MLWFTHAMPLIFSSLSPDNFFVALVRSRFTRGNISAGMTCPAAHVSIVAVMFTQPSLTSMTFRGHAQELFSTLSNDSWASFFNFNFDFLMTSCHCSLSFSSSKHHACSSISVFMHVLTDASFVFVHSVQTPVLFV